MVNKIVLVDSARTHSKQYSKQSRVSYEVVNSNNIHETQRFIPYRLYV